MRLLSSGSVLLLATFAGAQVTPGNAVVLIRLSGTPASQLVAVNLTTGAQSPLPRFPADTLPPLAIALDPIDGEMVLAMDAGAGISRVFRYTMMGGFPGNERAMGDIPGHVVELGFTDNQLLAAVDGAQGAVWRMPRNGGTSVQAFAQPYLSAMLTWSAGQTGCIAWSGSQGPPATDPGVGIVDLLSGQFALGPDTFVGYAHPGVTGVMDLPTALPRQLLSHTDGTVSLYTMLTSTQPVTVPVQPPVPAGGATAMKPNGPYGVIPMVLGGSAFPYLWTFDPFASSPVRTSVAGPLPGDPLDFAIAPASGAQVVFFGSACGTTMSISFLNLPQPGSNVFEIDLQAAQANAAALLVLGFSDQLGGMLPFTLPGGCPLLASPDAVLFRTTNGSGGAAQVLPVPAGPGLVDVRLYGQWLQLPQSTFAATAAIAVRIGP